MQDLEVCDRNQTSRPAFGGIEQNQQSLEIDMSKPPTGTVKSAKETADEKGKGKDTGLVSSSKNVTSTETVKNNPAADGSSKRAPGGKTKGL